MKFKLDFSAGRWFCTRAGQIAFVTTTRWENRRIIGLRYSILADTDLGIEIIPVEGTAYGRATHVSDRWEYFGFCLKDADLVSTASPADAHKEAVQQQATKILADHAVLQAESATKKTAEQTLSRGDLEIWTKSRTVYKPYIPHAEEKTAGPAQLEIMDETSMVAVPAPPHRPCRHVPAGETTGAGAAGQGRHEICPS